MQFLFYLEAGAKEIELSGDEYRYLFKVRRFKVGSKVAIRNLKDNLLYTYLITLVNRNRAYLRLVEAKEFIVAPKRYLHLGWCIIEPKVIEKTLPALNEIGVSKITFIECQRSQRNFKIDFKRLERILINSSQQCGRSQMLELDLSGSLREFLDKNPDSFLLDFSSKKLECNKEEIKTLIIGCEGGFSKEERALFDDKTIFGFDTQTVLRSENATISASARLLL